MILSWLDTLIIISYFAMTIVIGFLFRKQAGRSLTDFFISGRSLPWWIAGTSMVATTFAADTPLAVTGLVMEHGLAGNWLWWSFALGGMVTVFVYSRLWRRAEVVTDVELVEIRYAGKPAAALRAIRAIYVAFIINPIIIGWVTHAMVTVLNETLLYDVAATSVEESLFGSAALALRPWLIIAVSLSVVAVYGLMSGMWGVAITDGIQFFLAMFGCIALAWLAIDHFGSAANLEARVIQNFGEEGRAAFDFVPNLFGDSWMALDAFLVLLLVQWWATWYPGAEPGGGGYVVQRMAACRSERDSLLATLWYQVAHYCVRPWPWIIVAFAALAMYPELRIAEMEDSGFDSGIGFPMIMRDLSPNGLKGLLIVTFFAAFMSTISTQMNWGASYLARDIYQRFIALAPTNGS
jgi:SSS family solute:Na+ symporter